jgi:very-short-patch-repair endonuclease
MTPQEVKLCIRLRELRAVGLHFRRQSPLLSYIVDFECRRARLIVEVDGGQHAFANGLQRDHLRDESIAGKGYRILRFWNNEVDENLEGVLERIMQAAGQPHPTARFARGHPPLKGRD